MKEVVSAQKCHWQVKNAKGESKGFFTGLRVRGITRNGDHVLVWKDHLRGFQTQVVTNTDAFNFVETPVIEIGISREFENALRARVEVQQTFDRIAAERIGTMFDGLFEVVHDV